MKTAVDNMRTSLANGLLADEQVDLMRQGLSEDMAWEIVKEKIFLPPER